jgi:hypothetical protein
VFGARGMKFPEARERLIAALAKAR